MKIIYSSCSYYNKEG